MLCIAACPWILGNPTEIIAYVRQPLAAIAAAASMRPKEIDRNGTNKTPSAPNPNHKAQTHSIKASFGSLSKCEKGEPSVPQGKRRYNLHNPHITQSSLLKAALQGSPLKAPFKGSQKKSVRDLGPIDAQLDHGLWGVHSLEPREKGREYGHSLSGSLFIRNLQTETQLL